MNWWDELDSRLSKIERIQKAEGARIDNVWNALDRISIEVDNLKEDKNPESSTSYRLIPCVIQEDGEYWGCVVRIEDTGEVTFWRGIYTDYPDFESALQHVKEEIAYHSNGDISSCFYQVEE